MRQTDEKKVRNAEHQTKGLLQNYLLIVPVEI